MKLLVRPLYGDRPEIGIRELIQNAVDACRELKEYMVSHPEFMAADLPHQRLRRAYEELEEHVVAWERIREKARDS